MSFRPVSRFERSATSLSECLSKEESCIQLLAPVGGCWLLRKIRKLWNYWTPWLCWWTHNWTPCRNSYTILRGHFEVAILGSATPKMVPFPNATTLYNNCFVSEKIPEEEAFCTREVSIISMYINFLEESWNEQNSYNLS